MARTRTAAWYENTASLLHQYAYDKTLRPAERAAALKRIRALGFDRYDDSAALNDRKFWLGEFFDALRRGAARDLNRQDVEMISDHIDYLLGNRSSRLSGAGGSGLAALFRR